MKAYRKITTIDSHIKGIWALEVTKDNKFIAGFSTSDDCEEFIKQKDPSYKVFENTSDLGYKYSREMF